MRTPARLAIVALGFVALLSTGLVAQAPEKQENLVVTPTTQYRPRLDFGLEQAQKNLPTGPWKLVQLKPKHTLPMQASLPPELAPPADCNMVKTHQHHQLLPTMRVIEPPTTAHHHLKTIQAPPCPVR